MDLFKQGTIQDRVKSLFTRSIENDRLAHAYLFYGDSGRGKAAFAFELAKTLNCADAVNVPCNECPSCIKINNLNHPDVRFVFPVSKQTKPETITEFLKQKSKNPYDSFDIEGHKNIPIERIRELKNEAKYAPNEAKKRFFIIDGCEYFSREAANSFLKLLEEPPDNLIIILITNDLNALLDTIRSRCQPVFFPAFSEDQIKEIVARFNPVDFDIVPLIKISRHNLLKVLKLISSDSDNKREYVLKYLRALASNQMLELADVIDFLCQKRDKNYIIDFLDLLILWIRDVLHSQIMDESTDFINIDYKEPIEKFADFYKNIDLNKIIEMIETAIFDIERNAHPSLTLTNLAVQINAQLVLRSMPEKEFV
jgi:DNA polymerase III subunit delta'